MILLPWILPIFPVTTNRKEIQIASLKKIVESIFKTRWDRTENWSTQSQFPSIYAYEPVDTRNNLQSPTYTYERESKMKFTYQQ